MKTDKIIRVKSTHRNSAALRQRLLKKYDHTCVACGIKDDVVPLELAHLIPISYGGESSEDNLTILCPNCHRTFNRQPREYEFVSFLTELLEKNPSFSNIQREALLGREPRYTADLIVSRQLNDTKDVLMIECKTNLSLTPAHIQNVINQLEIHKSTYGECRMVLAVPVTLGVTQLSSLKAANIEVWDLQYIADNFTIQIKAACPSYYRALFLARITRPAKKLTREQELINLLSSCTPGKADCYVYQHLVSEILEFLFTPPLEKPIPELSDKSRANRRDFIMPNYSEKGFWSFLREKYEADYVVIDAKNYTRKVKKSEVLQIANYLKPHGAGLFGLIVSRNGGDMSGCEHTLREQWLVHRKLILVLNDEEVKAMLIAKSDGRQPEEILGQKIESFRLSM